VECDWAPHTCRGSCGCCGNLGVDVCEERLGSPPAQFHDGLRTVSGQPQGHCPGCAQRVRANTSKVVAAISEHSEASALPNGMEDVTWENIDSWLYKTNWCGQGHLLS
jgi:hypothetical protein